MTAATEKVASGIEWSEKNIGSDGMKFLLSKCAEVGLYSQLWDASIGSDFYSPSAREATANYVAVAKRVLPEIQALDKAIKPILDRELGKNTYTTQGQQLAKISCAASNGVYFLSSVINSMPSPTIWNQRFQTVTKYTNPLTVSVAALSAAAAFVNTKECSSIFTTTNPYWHHFQYSLIACVASLALSKYKTYLDTTARAEIATLKNIFDRSVLAKVTAGG